jgi:hypothetical protein
MVQASPFCGLPSEDANAHLQQFLELCDTIVIKDVAPEAIKLHLFPFSLVGKAKQWFYKDTEVVDTWSKCSAMFLAKFFPVAKPMPCGEESLISSKLRWNPSWRRGRGYRSASKLALTTGWRTSWCSKNSTMG